MNVAIKKIMKPFSAPVLAKRTYRELKLLKALMHENVSITHPISFSLNWTHLLIDYQFKWYFYFSSGRHVSHHIYWIGTLFLLTHSCSYFVTELLGTDLHRLLQSRPLEKQFIQYFLYQILVSVTRKKRQKWRTGYLTLFIYFLKKRGLKYVHSAGVIHRDLVRTSQEKKNHILTVMYTETKQYPH